MDHRTLGLNIFSFISHEKGLGRAKVLCHSPLLVVVESGSVMTYERGQFPQVCRGHSCLDFNLPRELLVNSHIISLRVHLLKFHKLTTSLS